MNKVKHGKILFSRCCIYLNLFSHGITETEIEDILSIDDEVLFSILKYHHPPKRRFPFYLWVLIKNDIQEYLTFKESDDCQVISWFHRRFFEVIDSMYKSNLSTLEYDQIIQNVIDYYTEKWNQTPKPFVYSEHVKNKMGLESADSAAIRFTKPQNIEYVSSDGRVRFNERKISELPFFISKLNDKNLKIEYLIDYVYFNFEFMLAKASLRQLDFLKHTGHRIWSIYNELDDSSPNEFKKSVAELLLIHHVYTSEFTLLHWYPKSFLLQISSKLMQICQVGNRFYKFLQSSLNESFQHCPLFLTKSYLPLLGKAKALTLLYDYKPFQFILNCPNTNYIFTSTKHIYFIDTVAQKMVEKYELSIDTVGDNFHSVKKLCVYFKQMLQTSLDNEKASNLSGGILLRYGKKLYSIDLKSKKVFFKKIYPEKIFCMRLLSTSSVLISCSKSKLIEVLGVTNSKILDTKTFTHAVKEIKTNTSEQEAFYPTYENFNIIVCVLLETGEINVFHYEKNNSNLSLINIIVDIGIDPVQSISDSFFHPESVLDSSFSNTMPMSDGKNRSRFAFMYKNGYLIILNLTLTIENGRKSVEATTLMIKFEIESYKNFKPMYGSNQVSLQDFFNNRLIFQVDTNCYSYDIGILYYFLSFSSHLSF